MRSARENLSLAVILFSVALAPSCKKSDETAAAASTSGSAAPATATPTAAPTDQPAAAPPPATPPPVATPAAVGAKPDAGAKPADAGAATTATAPAGGGTKSQACFQKCGAALQACLTPQPASSGKPPSIVDPTACNKLADQCRTACQ